MKRIHLFLYSAAAGFLTASVVMTGYFYRTLPSLIPTHFGISGAADAWVTKSPIIVFLAPLIGIMIFLLFLLIYRYPQYTSWPTTLILMTVEESSREKIFEILRSMNSLLLFWLSILFTYIQFSIIATGNGRGTGTMNTVMTGFLTVVLIIIIYVNVRMFITIRKLIKKESSK